MGEESGDIRWIARAQNNKSITLIYMGKRRLAVHHLEKTLRLFVELGDLQFQRRVLNNIADAYIRMGEKKSARRSVEKALKIDTPHGNRAEQAAIEITAAGTLDMPEQLPLALGMYRGALEYFRDLGDRRNQIACLNGIGVAYLEAGRPAEAAAHHRSALDLARNIGAAAEQSLYQLGRAESGMRRPGPALRHLTAAAALARDLNAPADEADAVVALAELAHSTGHIARGNELLDTAATAFESLDPVMAVRLRQRMGSRG